MQQANDFFSKLEQQLAGYLSKQQVAEVVKTYKFAYQAHDGQLRASGVPYITHPVAVASILAELCLDCESIEAALLHDVLEDTDVNKDQLAIEFGGTVAELVDGVSTLTHISFGSRAEEQAENFRKMILAMSRDIRVIIVKLADRLHNMRTLGSVSREKQRRKALETLEIYAPIAHRLGMHMIRTELEDLGFYYLYPIRYRVLKESVYKARGNRREMINLLMRNVQDCIAKSSVDIVEIVGREKHLYSLYTKMRQKDLPFSEIMDVYALRIVTAEIADCYQLLGIIHDLYKPIHNRFKDYIAIPKTNGYQSLHTTLIGPYGVPVEIQIRTKDMNYTAERGIAAHWVYKDQQEAPSAAETRTRSWLEGVLDIQKHSGTSLEFIENVKVDLCPTNVYVFTPTGKIFALPRGATIVDFAYAVHTDIGNSCITAKINRRLSPLNTKLSSGETVEIITAEGAHPNPAWLNFIVTAKARNKVRHWLKQQKDYESLDLGKRLLDTALRALGSSLDALQPQDLQKFLDKIHVRSLDELLQDIGLGNQLTPLVAKSLLAMGDSINGSGSNAVLSIKGTEGMVVIYSKCCNPIPGDSIVGFLSSGRGISIHQECCKNISNMRRHPEKYLLVQWDTKVSGLFSAKICVHILNTAGALAAVTHAVSKSDANIEDINADASSSKEHSMILLILRVSNVQHLNGIINKINAIDLVYKVERR